MTCERFTTITSIVLVVAGCVGCGGVDLVPVEGTVTLDGKPLVGATVALERTDLAGNKQLFAGDTDATGRYAIKPFGQSATGAIPGEYRIMITSVKAPPGADEMTVFPKEPVPDEYRNGSRTLAVPAEGIANADFTIKSH